MASSFGWSAADRQKALRSRTSRPNLARPGRHEQGGSHFKSMEAKDYRGHVSKLNRDAVAAYQQSLLDAAMQAQGGMGDGYGYGSGGGGGGGRGGFGGGGGGGYVDHLAGLRKTLEDSLNSQRDAARGALPQYLSQFNAQVGQIGADNQAQTGQYSAQIQALMQQLQRQAQGATDAIGGDLQAQGAGLGGFKAQADQALLGIGNIGVAQDAYNQRLAQMMAQAQADRLATGATVNQAASGQLDNAYLQALIQIQGMR